MSDPALPALLTRPWPQETVSVPGDDVGTFCSIAFDSQLLPQIACWRNLDSPRPELMFIRGQEGNWEAEVVDTLAGSGCALGLDSAGQPWIAFFNLDANSVSVAHREGGAWQVEHAASNIDALSAAAIALAIDSTGVPAICFSEDRGLRFARRSAAAGTWALETIDIQASSATCCSLAFGPGDAPHVTYCDSAFHGLRYATRGAEQWNSREIPDSLSPEFTSVVAGEQGSAHAAFWSLESGLHYVRISDQSLPPELVSDENGAGMFASIAIDQAGRPQIGYYNAGAARLEFALRTEDGWKHRTVDDSSDTGGYASLFIDRANSAHIAYYDWRARVLRVADSNRAPRPVSRQISTFVNVPVSGRLFSPNVDPDQDPVRAETTPIQPPAHGTVTIQASGDFTYTPNEGFSGTDAFTFQVTDSDGAFGTAVVTLDVQIPVIGAEFFSTRPKPAIVIAVKVQVHTVSSAPAQIEAVVERKQGLVFVDTDHRGRLPNLIISPRTEEFSTPGYRISYRVPAKNYVLAQSALFDMPANDGEEDLIIGGSLEAFDGPLR